MSDVSRPRFSVVVPALDEEAVIADCLRALAAQDVAVPFEVVVVDNGSTDATGSIAADFGARVVAEPRPGVCSAREAGRRAARGEIVVSTDADTTVAPDWLRTIDAAFRTDPAVVGVAGPCRFVDGPWWADPWARLLFGTVDRVARRTGFVGYVTATNLAFRAAAFDGYDVRLTQGGDELDLLRRLRRRGRVLFLGDNVTLTSSRRLERGLAYNLIVSLGGHYLLGYAVNRVARRTLIGTAPAFRPAAVVGRVRPKAAAAAVLVVAGGLAALRLGGMW